MQSAQLTRRNTSTLSPISRHRSPHGMPGSRGTHSAHAPLLGDRKPSWVHACRAMLCSWTRSASPRPWPNVLTRSLRTSFGQTVRYGPQGLDALIERTGRGRQRYQAMSALRSETDLFIDNLDKSSPGSPLRRRSFQIRRSNDT